MSTACCATGKISGMTHYAGEGGCCKYGMLASYSLSVQQVQAVQTLWRVKKSFAGALIEPLSKAATCLSKTKAWLDSQSGGSKHMLGANVARCMRCQCL